MNDKENKPKKGIIISPKTLKKLIPKDLAKTSGNIIIGTLNIAAQPGKMITEPARKIYRNKYHGKKFARAWFIIDAILLAVVISLLSTVVYLLFFRTSITDQVNIDATVAPREIVSGAASTLVFHYENNSKEELRNVRLSLGFPAYFELQEVSSDLNEIGMNVFDIGNLSPGATGNIKIKGVMFGDVGGKQKFKTTMSFLYGEKNKQAIKQSEHSFSPAKSTLALELQLPDKLVEGQEVEGTITYKNTGEVDFPKISIEPEWPEGFRLVSSSPALSNGRFRLTALSAGEEGTMTFVGRLPAGETIDFNFHPSFSFGDDHFRQESLVKNIPLLPAQLKVSYSLTNEVLTPGSTVTAALSYEHVGEFPIKNVELRIEASSPIFSKNKFAVQLGDLSPGDSGTEEITIPIRSSISASDTLVYENLTGTLQSAVSYVLPDGVDQNIVSYGDVLEIPVTSPVALQSFGRYASEQGDQLGRGPLPPYVGEETTYWVFMTLKGTTSELRDVKMEADLGPGVRFTGKQSVSVGDAVRYDESRGNVIWTIGNLEPTLEPGSRVVSVAFELGITPTEEMVGTSPILLNSPVITARDTYTGAFVSASGPAVTTNLPHDPFAAGYGVVEF